MLGSILIVVAVCLDAFFASVAYGVDQINIPLRSAAMVASIGSLFLAISLYAAVLVQQFVPSGVCKALSFSLLFFIGLSSLFQSTIKNYLRRRKQNSKKLKFHLSDISFVLDVYLDETKADQDNSKTLSVKESLYLGAALSVDSLVTGFGSGLVIANPLEPIFLSLIFGFGAVVLGSKLGKKIAAGSNRNYAWASGLLFITLAFLRIF